VNFSNFLRTKEFSFAFSFFFKPMQKRYINWWVWSFSKQIKIHFFYILKWYLFIFLKIIVFSTCSIWILFYAFLLRANVFVNKALFSKLLEHFLFSFWNGLKKWICIYSSSKSTYFLLIGTLGIIFFAIFFREPPRMVK
jgi:hypothetical protein